MRLPHALLAGFLALSASLVSASTTTIVSHYQDLWISNDGSKGHASDKIARIGNGSGDNQITSAVFLFELPELQPGQSIIDAVFTVGLDRTRNSPKFNAGLYGLGYRSTALVDPVADFYAGAFDGDASAIGLQDGFLTPEVTGGLVYATSEGGSANLTAYLNDLYQAGAQAGDFVALRLSPDVDSAGNYVCYEIAMSTYETIDMRPMLYVTVPEPATTAGLLGAAALGLVVVRRRFMMR